MNIPAWYKNLAYLFLVIVVIGVVVGSTLMILEYTGYTLSWFNISVLTYWRIAGIITGIYVFILFVIFPLIVFPIMNAFAKRKPKSRQRKFKYK